MLGAILGNILGSKYESQQNASKGLPQKPPRYTGDSVMTLAVAKWLLEDPHYTKEWLVHCMQKLGRGHLRAGYDEHLKEWIMSPKPKPYQGWDNKAAIRVSPVGLYAATLDETRELARMVAEVTHNHPDGVRSAIAVAECVFINRNRTAHNMTLADVKDFIRKRMTNVYGFTVSQTLEELRQDQASDGDGPEDITKAIYANYNSVQRAINVFLESDSLKDCVSNAAAIGGNPAPIAAIACSIFAANKEDWDVELMGQCERGLPHDLLNIMEEFEKLVFPTKPTLHSFKVTDNIYAGEYPRDRDEDRSVNKMRQFERFGISHFIDLTERGELASYKEFLYGMSHMRFPIRDVSVPESTDKVNNLLWQIDQILRVFPDMKIYIHCWGGVGRTGTIVGCLLAHQMGYDYDQTMAELRRLFKDCPKSAYRRIPETEEQRQFIARYIKNHCLRQPKQVDMYDREYTPEKISELRPDEIFVFGSNLAGSHGGGAARFACEHFGAKWGQGVGLQGQCYAIPTMQGGVETIKPYVDEFIYYAQAHPEYNFLVTRIGCGIAGFHDDEIAPLFSKAIEMDNVILPREFVEVLQNRHESRFNLKRFLNAQKKNYEEALQEIRDGNKQTDWIWYVFPQLQVLGHSRNSRYFGISGYEEAEEYLNHPILGRRLREVTEAFLAHRELSAKDIFGHLDAKKVQSCMTLFDAVSPDDIFEQVLEIFYNGNGDKKTLDLM